MDARVNCWSALTCLLCLHCCFFQFFYAPASFVSAQWWLGTNARHDTSCRACKMLPFPLIARSISCSFAHPECDNTKEQHGTTTGYWLTKSIRYWLYNSWLILLALTAAWNFSISYGWWLVDSCVSQAPPSSNRPALRYAPKAYLLVAGLVLIISKLMAWAWLAVEI